MPTESIKAACIILCADKGDVRSARGIASRAIRSVLPRGRYVSYNTMSECGAVGMQDPRYTFDCTEGELDAIIVKAREEASSQGWDKAPIEAYRD